MEETYCPTKREIFGEMWNETKESLGTAARQVGRFGAGLLLASTFPYTMATHSRVFMNWTTEREKNEGFAFRAGAVIGFYAALTQGITCALVSAKENRPEILLIPAATNVASGAYELGRYMYRSAKQRVLEKHKPADLETQLEVANSAQ